MSMENENEVISHQSCHSDDILEHIDDGSQQEYFEKMAPKAQEEMLIINQDCDSSPADELEEKLLSFTTENEEKQNGENNLIGDELLDNTENENVKDNFQSDKTEVTEYPEEHIEEAVIQEDESCKPDLTEETQIEELNNLICESDIKDDQVIEPEESENVENSELKNDEIVEGNVNDENSELKNDEIVESHVNDENPEIKEEKLVDNAICVDAENIEACEEEIQGEQPNDIQLEENVEINNIQDTTVTSDITVIPKLDEEKLIDNKKTTDIKALSSSYNNENIVNLECEICKKNVYPLEKLSVNDRIFHKQCFRCSKCRCALLAGNFSFNNDKPYCRPHYIELFKKRGRYDEIDDGEITAQQTIINDVLTDELPAPDITKNLLAKFRDLEAGTGSAASIPTANADGSDELPAPNTTKNLMERFTALGKDNDREQKRKPMIEIPRSGENSGACENQPICLPKDVARANDPSHDEMPEQGITKNLVNRFRDLESTGVASK